MTAISPSSRYTTRRVYGRRAAASEAAKTRPLPRPITSGDPLRAQTILPGSRELITAMPKVPSTMLSARATLRCRGGSQCSSIR